MTRWLPEALLILGIVLANAGVFLWLGLSSTLISCGFSSIVLAVMAHYTREN